MTTIKDKVNSIRAICESKIIENFYNPLNQSSRSVYCKVFTTNAEEEKIS